MKMATVEAFMLRQPADDTPNPQGNTVRRAFLASERYVCDFADDFKAQGWRQYDTDQDAHYFGAWVNPVKRLVLTYAEGDWSLVECADRAHYNAEIAAMNAYYGEGYVAKTIDADGAMTVYRQDRATFAIKEG